MNGLGNNELLQKLEWLPDFQGGEREPLSRLNRNVGSRRNSGVSLSVRSEVGLRIQARLPRVQLGRIENMLIFVLEGALGLHLGEVTVEFSMEEMSQWARRSLDLKGA